MVPPAKCDHSLHEYGSHSPDTAIRIASAAVWRDDVDVRDRTELLVAWALASREVGDAAQAHEMFRRAHVLSTDTGNAQPLLLVPVDVRSELLEATGLRLDTDVLADLDTMRPPYPERADMVRLSPREREVLRQIAYPGTAADIARTLTVSVNTVKKQLVSLYLKLGVSDRASALLRAEALGLLDAPPRGTTLQKGVTHTVHNGTTARRRSSPPAMPHQPRPRRTR